MEMSSIIITHDTESLQLASNIVDKIFSDPSNSKTTNEEWEKWKSWFSKQKNKFELGKISLPNYFTQVKRVQQFFLNNTLLTETEIFEMEIKKREKQYTIPWIDLIQHKIDEIYEGKSDINPYGATNKSEFFAVISEYFFERPKLLKDKHPKLYELLEEIFNQTMTSKVLKKKSRNIGRNDSCPCGSGEKFKRCCGKEHYR